MESAHDFGGSDRATNIGLALGRLRFGCATVLLETQFAKEVGASPPKYGNFDYFFAPNQPTRSARITHDVKMRHHEQCPPLTVLISVAPPR
jgi:hypothetical protein